MTAALRSGLSPLIRCGLLSLLTLLLCAWIAVKYILPFNQSALVVLLSVAAALCASWTLRLRGEDDVPASTVWVGLLSATAAASIIRLVFFNGIYGHDDFAYLLAIRRTLSGGYQDIITPHGLRFLVWVPAALLVKFFGPSYSILFVPSFMLSMGQTVLAYALCRITGLSRRCGVLAAWLMALHPLDVFVSTTVRGDMEAGVLSAVCLLALAAAERDRMHSAPRQQRLLLFVLGCLLTVGMFAKPTNWAAFVVVGLIALQELLISKRVPWRFCWTAAGVLLVLILQGVIFHAAAGNALAFFKVGLMDYAKARAEGGFIGDPTLGYTFMPAMMFDLPQWNEHVGRWYVNNYAGFGVFFYLAFLPFLFFPQAYWQANKLVLLWMLGFLLYLNFGTMSFREYLPIHKEPRHLAVVTLPIAVAASWTLLHLSAGLKMPRAVALERTALFLLLLAVFSSSLFNVGFHHARYEAPLAAIPEVADYVSANPDVHFWGRHNIVQQIDYRSGFERPSAVWRFPGSTAAAPLDDLNFFKMSDAPSSLLILQEPVPQSYLGHPNRELAELALANRLVHVTSWGSGTQGALGIYGALDAQLLRPQDDSSTKIMQYRVLYPHCFEDGARLFMLWSGVVDGTDDVVVSGREISLQHISFQYPKAVFFKLLQPVAGSPPAEFVVLKRAGRGSVTISELPSPIHDGRLVIRIDDALPGGEGYYDFALAGLPTTQAAERCLRNLR
jgi:hypothetical protein